MAIVTHQFNFQTPSATGGNLDRLFDNIQSYQIKYIGERFTVVSLSQGIKTISISIPSDCLWWTKAEDKTDWSIIQ